MFSGNSLRNQTWIHEVRAHLGDLADSTYLQEYEHWSTGEEWINLSHELEVLKVAKLAEPYAVFAKSIGSVLTVQAIEGGIIKPKFLLFCGLPLGYIVQDYPQFGEELAKINLPTTVIHNEHDVVGGAAETLAYLGSAVTDRPNFKFITTPGDTHDYENYDLLHTELAHLEGRA